jgi:small GTP-binding protein
MIEAPVIKVVVVGDGGVGKTTLIRRYVEGKFHASRVATIGVDFYTQRVELPTGLVKLSIWDMAGQERFEVVRGGFYGGSRAAALVFDVTDLNSLKHLQRWRNEVLQAGPDQPLLIVGNKIDLPRTVPARFGRTFASYVRAPYLETSALSGEGVTALFEILARLAVPGK